MNIVEVAQQYFDLSSKGNGVYQIVNPTGGFDSVVLWESTNSYCRFSTMKTGGPREFLKYIVGLSDDEIGEEVENDDELLKLLKHHDKQKNDTGYSLLDIVYQQGYNEYIASRGINKDTAVRYNLEVMGNDVIIPLYDRSCDRIGSLVRNSNPEVKGDRYRTLLVGNKEKPCIWPFPDLIKSNQDSIIVLVEGAWSAMRIHQIIKPKMPQLIPLATMGTNLTEELRDITIDVPIICILDNDTGGKKVESTLSLWKREKSIEIYKPTFKSLAAQNESSPYVDDFSDENLLRLFRMIYKHSKILKRK